VTSVLLLWLVPRALRSERSGREIAVHTASTAPVADTPSKTLDFRDGRVLVCIPTYNELANLPVVLRRLRDAVPTADVLVIDDNSPDGTGALAEELATRDGKVHVLHRKEKSGLGGAYLAGFAWATERGYTVVVEMDADGSHRPEELSRLLHALDDPARSADVVLGSRYVPGGEVEDWPVRRLLLSRIGNAYARFALRLPVHDATGGYRAYRTSIFPDLDLETVASQGYCFQVDLVWRAHRTGHLVTEVPITFVERRVGTSKMDSSIVREALWRITVWGVTARSGGRARRRDARADPIRAVPARVVARSRASDRA
jgi:dolichol-phosphate mannosyltransferase